MVALENSCIIKRIEKHSLDKCEIKKFQENKELALENNAFA